MDYKTIIIEKGVRGGRFKKPLKIRVPLQQNEAEKKLLQYILESLSTRSCLIPFTPDNLSMIAVARHLLFNKTGSPLTLFGYMDDFH